VVVGPGLGRDPMMMSTVKKVMLSCKERDLPMVIDADGISIIIESPELAKDYCKVCCRVSSKCLAWFSRARMLMWPEYLRLRSVECRQC
jgi:hypothetical protein